MYAGKNIGFTVGIVLDRKDPDDLGRVKLTLPEYGNIETDWCRVVLPFAGKNDNGAHGAWCVPEKDDEVIVGMHQGDPKQLCVLGSVYSKERKPPVTEVKERRFQTPKKNIVIISDADGSERIHLETPENSVTLSKSGKKISIVCKNSGPEIELDANAGSITIKAKTVTVEAPSITLKGKVDVTG